MYTNRTNQCVCCVFVPRINTLAFDLPPHPLLTPSACHPLISTPLFVTPSPPPGRPQPRAEESAFRTGSYNKSSSSSSLKSGGGNISTRSFPSFSSLTAAAGPPGGSSGKQSSNDRLTDLMDDDKTMLNIQGRRWRPPSHLHR